MKPKNNPLEDYLPTANDVDWFLKYWKELPRYADQEKALDKLFRHLCRKNDCLEDVLIKCSALNDFYSTNIYDVHSMAEHIYNMKIDKRLGQKDLSLVNDIARVEINGRTHNFYSFATKYCSHHQPEDYAIYDNYVEKVLVAMTMNKKDPFGQFKKEDLKDYRNYMRVILSFRQHYELTQYSIKQLDQYLWQLGKWYFNSYGPRFKYYNRENRSPFPEKDVRSKFWHGEKVFVENHESVGYWKEEGQKLLQNADPIKKQRAEEYTPEQFGVVLYINCLFEKWCPNDELDWIFEY